MMRVPLNRCEYCEPALPTNNRVQGVKHDEKSAATGPYCVMVFVSAGNRKREMDQCITHQTN